MPAPRIVAGLPESVPAVRVKVPPSWVKTPLLVKVPAVWVNDDPLVRIRLTLLPTEKVPLLVTVVAPPLPSSVVIPLIFVVPVLVSVMLVRR